MEAVLLEPFPHQVGGHQGLLRFNDATVCKPVIVREVHFYKSMPDQLKLFCPQYKGTAKVTCVEDSSGYISIFARPTESSTRLVGPIDNHRYSKFRLRKSGSIELESSLHDVAPESSSEAASSGEEGPVGHDSAHPPYNPWSLRCHKKLLARLRNLQNSEDFILLENLTRNYRCPCVLDLKMGTRQHGDEVSETKKASQTQKCEESTSKTLGLRICGMQVYQVMTGKFFCQDKYKGRRLDSHGVRSALQLFLHNGRELRLDLIPVILERLHQLYATLQALPTFRFYSSSLLVMYEGAVSSGDVGCGEDSFSSASEPPSTSVTPPSPPPISPIDVRMIDFAHSTFEGFPNDNVVHIGPDSGYLLGLQSLIRIFQEIFTQFEPPTV